MHTPAYRPMWYALAAVPLLYWLSIIIRGARGFSKVPQLRALPLPEAPETLPKVSIIVPARNEERQARACLEGLLDQTYPNLEIIFVNDRSTDSTARIADEVAARSNGRIVVEHVTECPPDWLGKCNALALGAAKATGEYLLFTDGDVLMEPTTVARAVNYAVAQNADMLVVFPDAITETFGERCLMMAFGNSFAAVFSPSAAQDKRSKAFVGVGAFNMVRTYLYKKVQGHRFLRLQVIDDIGLGKLIKFAGGVLRVAAGTGMVRVRWHWSLWETIKGLEKNGFAAFNYNPVKTTVACIGLLFVCWWPYFGLLAGPWPARAMCAFAGLILQPLTGVGASRVIGINPLYGFTNPIGAIFLATAMLRSMIVTLRQKGIVWRDSFYPLTELRKFRL